MKNLFSIVIAALFSMQAVVAEAADAYVPKVYGKKDYVWDEMTPERIEVLKRGGDPVKGKESFRGCQGCHKIGENGNAGPGPDLTHIGARLPRNAIARTLVNPTAPMPSFVNLQKQHPDEFNSLVDFLASLK